MVADVGEEAERRKGGREESAGAVGEVLVRIRANWGLSGVEEEEVETDKCECVQFGVAVVLRNMMSRRRSLRPR